MSLVLVRGLGQTAHYSLKRNRDSFFRWKEALYDSHPSGIKALR